MRTLLPIPLLGIDTDNDSAFMNGTLLRYCKENSIEQTRSRAYLKNHQAWVEQKNGAVVRRFVGHDRLAGVLAAQVLGRLHGTIRLYVNFFQPSFKLREKTRVGAKTHRSYLRPATPCHRLLSSEHVDEDTKQHLREQRANLDPLRLLHAIGELQATVAALAKSGGSGDRATPESKSFDEFLKQLPRLWEEGEVRPTHRREPAAKRTWLTRADPFASAWPALLHELRNDPDMTAKELFDRSRARCPGCYEDGQLRTLQKRVQGWRRLMTRELIGISNIHSHAI